MLYNNPMYNQTYPGGYGHEYGMPSSGHHIHHQELVETIQHCESVCEHMITHIKMHYDLQMRIRQLQLLRDCADICGLTANYVARNSMFAKQTAQLCGHICEVCGNECARFSDAESQHCAHVCLNCARECYAFACM